MRHGQISSKFALTIPTVFIDPAICFTKEGDIETDIVRAIADLWKNYDVNIRYLHVVKPLDDETYGDTFVQENYVSRLPHKFQATYVFDYHLLSFLQPDNIACFFGKRDVVPTNHKVFDKYQLANDYKLILSAQRRTGINSNSRYLRRRDV